MSSHSTQKSSTVTRIWKLLVTYSVNSRCSPVMRFDEAPCSAKLLDLPVLRKEQASESGHLSEILNLKDET